MIWVPKRGIHHVDMGKFLVKTTKQEILGFRRETINRRLAGLLFLQIISAKLQAIFPEKIFLY